MKNTPQRTPSAGRPGKRSDRPTGGFSARPTVKKARWVPRTPATPSSRPATAFPRKSVGPARPYTPRSGSSSGARPYTPRSTPSGARPYTPRNDTRSTGARPYPSKPRTTGTTRPYTPRAAGAKAYTPRSNDRTLPARKPYSPSSRTAPTRPYGAKAKIDDRTKSYTPRGDARTSGAISRPKTARVVTPKRPRTQLQTYTPKVATTSWGTVADWYENHLSGTDTYHEKVILPNLLRLVEPRRGEGIVDLACGTGYFTRALATGGATLTGIDISEELIAIARKDAPQVSFHVASAEKFAIVNDQSKDKAIIVLAIQNIEHAEKVFAEAARVLKMGGTFHVVMNHPAFRIPKQSAWDYDDKKKVQYRRVDQYLSESTTSIDMHPGMKDSPQTLTFHRPLQYYFKALAKAGFMIDRLEEWNSHKDSDSGPRAKAENTARKEIPLFLYLRGVRK